MAELSQEALEAVAAKLGSELIRLGWSLAAAESCTGGWAAQAITAIAGSSAWFDRGFVTYTNQAKMDMLGVRAGTLERHGAVSEETVIEMAEGALAQGQAKAAFAISGIAGPSGGSDSKPVGTVCFAWTATGRAPHATTQHFEGDRRMVRMQSVEYALRQMQSMLAAMP